MKKPEEVEQLAEKYYPSYPDGIITDEIKTLREGFIKGYRCQEDIVKGIRFLIYRYKSDILLLEEEFRDSSSVLTVEKIVTLESVVKNLENII